MILVFRTPSGHLGGPFANLALKVRAAGHADFVMPAVDVSTVEL